MRAGLGGTQVTRRGGGWRSKRASRIPTAGRGADTAREQHALRGAGRAGGGTAAARRLSLIHFEDWNSRAPQSKRPLEPEARESSPAHSPRAGCELQSHSTHQFPPPCPAAFQEQRSSQRKAPMAALPRLKPSTAGAPSPAKQGGYNAPTMHPIGHSHHSQVTRLAPIRLVKTPRIRLQHFGQNGGVARRVAASIDSKKKAA